MEKTEENTLILNKINKVVDAVKVALGITDEVVTEEVAQSDEDIQEEQVEVEEVVSEETEVVNQEQEEQPSQDSEENEPSEEEAVETEEVGQEEPVVEEEAGEEEQTEQVEEPAEQEETEEPAEEIEAVENSIEVAEIEIPSETNEVEVTEDNTSALLQEIATLKAEKEAKDIELQKMALAKEVEQDFGGVPGKVEDKVDTIFEIKNSSLSEDTKTFIINSLKSLSIQNLTDCEEIGHDQEVEVNEEEEKKSKIDKAMKEHGLTENQAFLYVNGDRTLAEAKKLSSKVRGKRQ